MEFAAGLDAALFEGAVVSSFGGFKNCVCFSL